MSNPGLPMNGMQSALSQMDPAEAQAMLQQYQDQQRKMAMAQQLMGNQAQGQNGGMANAGNSILGAITMKNMMQQQDPQNQMASQTIQQRYGMSPGQAQGVMNPSLMSKIGGLFNMGGGG